MRAPPVPENFFHRSVNDVLERWLSPGWRYTHIPNGEHRNKVTAARLKKMGVRRGWPDFIFLAPNGRPHFLELKRMGGRLSEPQTEFQDWCRSANVPHAVCDRFEAAIDTLKRWEAVRISISV